MKSKKGILINAIVFGAIILGYVVVIFFTSQSEPPTLSFESESLQVQLAPLSGDSKAAITLKEFRGRPMLLHFWASWCKPCDTELPRLEKLIRGFDGSPVHAIGIVTGDDREAVEKSGKLSQLTFPQYLDGDGNLASAMKIKTLPQTLLVDAQGRVVRQYRKEMDEEQLADLQKQWVALTGPSSVLGLVPPFEFSKSTGGTLKNTDLAGKVWVADFIFTSCPGRCPMLTSKMHTLQEAFKSHKNFRLVSVSVDPETDTPPALLAYQKKHGADPEIWYFLTGKMAAVKSLLVSGFHLGTSDRPDFHSSRFALVGADGRIRGLFDVEEDEGLNKLKAEIQHLLK